MRGYRAARGKADLVAIEGRLETRQWGGDGGRSPRIRASIGRVNWAIVWGLLASLAAVWLLFLVVLWVLRPRDMRLVELVRIVPDVLRLVRDVIRDRAAPLGVRVASFGLIAWLLNPIDLIPEFVPVLGPLDDVVVAVLVLRYVRNRLGEEAFSGRWPGTPEGYALLSRVLGGT